MNLSVAQSIFKDRLITHLGSLGFAQQEIQGILSAGSADVRRLVSEAQLTDVLNAYNYGITRKFSCATNVAAVAFVVSLGMQWRSIRPRKSPAQCADAETKEWRLRNITACQSDLFHEMFSSEDNKGHEEPRTAKHGGNS